jgi:choline dehydrogenase-like flavoprotein
MLIDSSVAPGTVLDADVCIVGAGPAGIAMAREFIGSSIRVVLLESGKFENDSHIEELSQGKVNSRYLGPAALELGRKRQFGGTPNAWLYRTEPWDGRLYARCVPPEPLDFERDVCDSGLSWPFSFDEMLPYFKMAVTLWNGGSFDYRIDNWAGGLRPIESPSGVLKTRIAQHGPSDVFTIRYRQELVEADNIDLHLGCTAVALESDGLASRIGRLRIARDGGSTFSVTATIYVLACGGIENVQLLLASDAARPGAAGNRYDNVGRYVTDHPEFCLGFVFTGQSDVYEKLALYDIRWVGEHMASGFLTLSEDLKRSERLLNMSVALSPRGPGFGTAAHRAVADVAASIRHGEVPARPFADIGSVLGSPLDAVAFLRNRRSANYSEYRGGWSQRSSRTCDFRAFELWAACEQTPHRDNRLTLIDDRDWLGRNRLRFDHCWSDADRRNIRRSIEIITAEISAAGLGRLRPWYHWEGSSYPRFAGLHHPMGGTRMHVEPHLGVVDENCLVHGLFNVYVAGSSVFPTGIGYANPTLTLLAVAMRLAEHLKEKLGVSSG